MSTTRVSAGDRDEILDAVSGLKRGKWISAAIACELPREVSEVDLYYGISVTCKCGGTFDAYQTHDDDGKPSGWYIPFHPKGGDEEARAAIEKRGNEAVDEAVIAAYEAGRASVMISDIHMSDGETLCGADCEECRARSKSDLCAGQPNATQCTRPVAYAIRPVGHRVPTHRCMQCYCQPVTDRNAAWHERYEAFQRARKAERERDEARAQAAAMREALQHVRAQLPVLLHGVEFGAKLVDEALAPDAGRALLSELAALKAEVEHEKNYVSQAFAQRDRAVAEREAMATRYVAELATLREQNAGLTREHTAALTFIRRWRSTIEWAVREYGTYDNRMAFLSSLTGLESLLAQPAPAPAVVPLCMHPIGPEPTHGAGPLMCGQPSQAETWPPRCRQHAHAPAGAGKGTAKDDKRCAWCGWSLTGNVNSGCVRGNCSLRPLPSTLYDYERAMLEAVSDDTREYIKAHCR